MDNVFSELIKVLEGETGSSLQIFKAEVTNDEPLIISVGGEQLPSFTKNKDLHPEIGDTLLCLFDGEEIYIICRM